MAVRAGMSWRRLATFATALDQTSIWRLWRNHTEDTAPLEGVAAERYFDSI